MFVKVAEKNGRLSHRDGDGRVFHVDGDGDGQSSIKCCSAAAPLRAEQGPCEPSEDVVRKFGEQ